ncbi:MAG: methionine/alanine import family NSS transporter small subunit [Acidobacteriota bacterium]
MNPTAVLTMVLVLSIVWGGFAFCLKIALQREREKK